MIPNDLLTVTDVARLYYGGDDSAAYQRALKAVKRLVESQKVAGYSFTGHRGKWARFQVSRREFETALRQA